MTRAPLLLAALALTVSCRSGGQPPTPPSPARQFQAPGLDVSRGCTLNTEERCNDAIDGNCNGLIDEGCGGPSSSATFQIAWLDRAADVDLEVYGPSGELANMSVPSADGLVKNMDCPADPGCRGRGYELVYLGRESPAPGESPRSEPAPGIYRVTVILEALGARPEPVEVTLGVRIGRETHQRRLRLAAPGDARTFAFSH